MRYLLDTDHCSYLQRRHPEVIRHLQAMPVGTEVFNSVITQGELLAGIQQAPGEQRRAQLRLVYEQMLANISEFLPVTSKVAEQFANILTMLVRKGRPIPVNDMWIASIALANGLILVSSDIHYQYIDGLSVEDWTRSPTGPIEEDAA